MLIGSLVELHVELHSCLCFSHLEKLFLKASSTPPRYLLDSWLFVELLKLFLIANLTTSRHLVDRSRKLLSPRQLLDTWWIDQDLFSLLLICPSTDPRQLHLSTSIMLDTCLATPRSIEILLHALFFTCLAYFGYLCVHSIFFFFFLQVYGSLFSLFPLYQFSVCLCHVFWLFMPFDNRVKKGEKFEN